MRVIKTTFGLFKKIDLKNQKGFTLLETLLAMVILSGGLILLSQAWSSSFAKVRKTQMAYEVGALLERKMAEIDMEYRGKPLDSIPDEKSEDFGSNYPNYKWKIKSKMMEFPDLTPLMASSKEGGADPNLAMMVKMLTAHLSKSVKEVTVSVLVKNGKKDLVFSVTTYFVDYDVPIAVSPGG
jgi:general secretion pathway protein I